MKNTVGLLVPTVLMLFGAYALLTTLGSSGEQVTLISDHAIPRGLALVFGLIGLGGGSVALLTTLSNKKHTASSLRE
jgi:hypothetical protein